MKSNDCTKSQMFLRYKTAYRSLIITLGLIFIDAILKEYYIWATPLPEAAVLICIPTSYFVTVTLFRDTFTKIKEKSLNSWIGMFGAVGLLMLYNGIHSYVNNRFAIVKNGQLQIESCYLIVALFFVYLTIILMVKKHLGTYVKG